MGLLFRSGDGRNAKLVIMAFMVLTGVALIGLLDHQNLVPYPTLKPWAMAAGLVVAVCALVAVCKDTNPASRFVQSGPVKRFGLLVLLFPLSWSLGFFAVWLGVPSIWASVALAPKVATTSVTHVLRERSGRGCRHRITIEGAPLPEAMTPCVSKELRASVRPGSVVEIKYTDSAVAFVIHDVALAK